MTKSKIQVKSSFLKAPDAVEKRASVKRNSSRKLPFILAFTVIFLAALCIGIIFFSGFLNVKNIKVIGNAQVATIDIENVIKKQTENKLILSVNPTDIEKSLLDKFSTLSFARVTKDLPSTLKIEVKERSKSAIIKTLDNIVLVSEDGTVISEITEDKISNNIYQDLQIVKLIDEPKRSLGYKFDLNLIKSISNFQTFWKTQKAPAYSDIIIDRDKNVKVILTNSVLVQVSFNDPNLDYNRLIQDFIAVYNKVSATKKIKSIDMRIDNKVAVSTV